MANTTRQKLLTMALSKLAHMGEEKAVEQIVTETGVSLGQARQIVRKALLQIQREKR